MRAIRMAVAFAGVVMAASGCIKLANRQSAPDAQAAAVPASGRELFDSVVDRLFGTTEQREAAQAQQWYAWQSLFGECLTAKGVDFDLPAYTPPQLGRFSPGELLAFTPRTADFGIARAALVRAKGGTGDNPALLETNGLHRERWLRAQQQCEQSTGAAEQMGVAPGVEKLGARLLEDVLIKAQDELAPGLRASWTTCMTAAGVPVRDGLVSAAYQSALDKFPAVTAGEDPTQAEGWAEAVAYEKFGAASDWKCRAAEATRVIEASADRLSAWEQQNRVELDKVAAEWAERPGALEAAKAKAHAVAAE